MTKRKYAYGVVDGVPNYSAYAVKVGKTTRVADSLSRDEALAIGLKLVREEAPEAQAGTYARPAGWTETDTTVDRTYEVVAITPSPRVFSKLKCYEALVQAGYWDAVQSWLEANGLWTAFLLAQDVSEDNEQFAAGLAALKEALGLTDEQVEAILSNCEAE